MRVCSRKGQVGQAQDPVFGPSRVHGAEAGPTEEERFHEHRVQSQHRRAGGVSPYRPSIATYLAVMRAAKPLQSAHWDAYEGYVLVALLTVLIVEHGALDLARGRRRNGAHPGRVR